MSKNNPTLGGARLQTGPPTVGFTTERLERLRAHPPDPAPAVPASLRHVRGEVVREVIESIPLVRAYRGYQQMCVRKARQRDPAITAGLTDREVWNLLTPPAARTDHPEEPQT